MIGKKMNEIVLELKNITKEFPGVKALNNVSFDVREGEVHALVGENGSGKSTLMNIMSGVYQPTWGEIYLHNRLTRIKDPKDGQDKGINMIHQELSLARPLNVMENVFIGRQIKNKAGFLDTNKMKQLCINLFKEYEIENINYNDIVRDLSIPQMQLIEIIKAVNVKCKILVMDEPTTSLTYLEVAKLFKLIEKLKKDGYSIIFISHRLEEVKKIADRITILRDGKIIVTKDNNEMEIKEIVSYMVGREFDHMSKRKNISQNEKALEVKHLSSKKIHDITFDLKKGEVLGVTGLVGSGRTELIQTIFGDEKFDSGEIHLFGKNIKVKSIRNAIELGFGLIPEDRRAQGIFSILDIQDNISMVKRKDFSWAGFLNFKIINKTNEEMRDKLKIKTSSMDEQIKYLSGGNQQKVIIGRWLMNKPQILFMDEPTHGVDIGAKQEIYQIINDMSKLGVSIVFVSSELPEILTLCDRIIVMNKGRIKGEFDNIDITQDQIMEAAVI
jgi:ABC-type sugar transport system ATPase subunit